MESTKEEIRLLRLGNSGNQKPRAEENVESRYKNAFYICIFILTILVLSLFGFAVYRFGFVKTDAALNVQNVTTNLITGPSTSTESSNVQNITTNLITGPSTFIESSNVFEEQTTNVTSSNQTIIDRNLSDNVTQLDQRMAEYNEVIQTNANKAKCDNIVPGIMRMSRGVDITKLDLFPPNIQAKDGFASVLFEFSCVHAHTWTHPNIENYHYNFPDQIEGINTLSSASLTVTTSFHQNIKKFKESLAVNVGLDVSIGLFGSFSASASYEEAKEHIMKSNKSISEASADVSAIEIDFQASEQMQLNQNFLNYIYIKLPLKYEDDAKIYNEFIDTFGTHYFTRANFGGLLYQKTVIENSYLYKTDEKKISTNVEAKFGAFASLKAGVDTSSSSLDEDFNCNSETHSYHYGGMTDFASEADKSYLSKWFETAHKDPWLFGGKLVPIEKLIKNTTIQSQVKKAISVYRAKAFLKDFKHTLKLGQGKLPQETMSLLNRIEYCLYNPKSCQYTIKQIGNDIEDMFGKLQHTKDRGLLQEYYNKMANTWDTAVNCKRGIAKLCSTSAMKREIQNQDNEYRNVQDMKISRVLNRSAPPDSDYVVQLVKDATKLMQSHQTTVVDLCVKGDGKCQRCLQGYVDCLYSDERVTTCKNPIELKNIGYQQPKRVSVTYKNGKRVCQ